MIQYEKIDVNDMQVYWGKGYVIVPVGKHLYGYLSISFSKTSVVLRHDVGTMVEGLPPPPETMEMTHNVFFQNVMLHRPPLGVLVRSDEEVVLLGWQHANGQRLSKAITEGEILCTPIVKKKKKGKEIKEEPDWVDFYEQAISEHYATCYEDIYAFDQEDILKDMMRHSAYSLTASEATRIVARYVDRPHRGNGIGIKYLLEFLNQERSCIEDAEGTTTNLYLSETAWLRYKDEKYGWDLMNGSVEQGRIDPTLQFSPLKGELSSLIGQALYSQLIRERN